MPTILRFRGFNIGFYIYDHEPAHVHVKGGGKELVVVLGCGGGPVEVRGRFNILPSEEALLLRYVRENRDILCKAWREIHDRYKGV